MKSILRFKALMLIVLLLGMCGLSTPLQAQTVNFDPVALSEFINRPLQDFNKAHASLTQNSVVAFQGQDYRLAIKADEQGKLQSLELYPDDGTLAHAVAVLEHSQSLGNFFGAKFSGASGGLKKTVEETISLMNSDGDKLRIASVFNPKSGVYFVLDWNIDDYKLVLTRNFMPLNVEKLLTKVGSDFEKFYQENYYISNKINMFGLINLYFDAVRNDDMVNFTMNCDANAGKDKVKEISIYLNKTDNESLAKSIAVWKKEAAALVSAYAESTISYYSTDAFGGVKQHFASLDEAVTFVENNQRKDGVIISIEAGNKKVSLIINAKSVFYLLQLDENKAAILLHYELPLESPLSFELSSNSNVLVDWGDGKKVDMGNKSMVSGKLLGTDIHLYGDITTFDCSTTKAKAIDVSGASALTELLCAGNMIEKLQLNYNPMLKSLDCENNKLTKLNTTKLTKLEKLLCSENALTSIDLSCNEKLKRLMITDNHLGSLDLSHNPALWVLNCSGNKIGTLDLSGNAQLVQLIAGGNQIETINTGVCPDLEKIVLKNNRIETIDLQNNPAVQILNLSSNQLTSLKTTAMKQLTECFLDNNKLTAIETVKMPAVMRLQAGKNNMPGMTVESNTKMRDLYVYGNKFNFDASQALAESIYDRSNESMPGHIYIIGTGLQQENQITQATAKLFTSKNWELYRVAEAADGNLEETLLTDADINDFSSALNEVATHLQGYDFDGETLISSVPMAHVKAFDTTGRVVACIDAAGNTASLDTLPTGIYVLMMVDTQGHACYLKVAKR